MDNAANEQTTPSREKSFDAVRRHICQVLGFDVGFIDMVTGHEIVTISSFASVENDPGLTAIVESLQDEHKQPLSLSNTLLAQKVKQTQSPWKGRVYSTNAALDQTGHDDGYPYAIVPILVGSHHHPNQAKGLLRVLSFDANREINDKDLSTLRLVGEHLSANMPQFAEETPLPEENQAPLPEAEPILIVHSNRSVRRRFSRILSTHYKVIEAENSDKALELLNQNSIQLVVLDSDMQGASGYGFCKVIKESPPWKHIPVILVTPDSNPSARAEGLNVGADDCLAESCLDQELLARVRSSLRHRKAERELSIQLELLEDYAQRLEQATEKLSKEKQIQLQQSKQTNLLRRESEMLRNQEALLHRISNTIRRSLLIQNNLQEVLEEVSGYFNLDCCFVILPSQDEPDDSVRCEYASDDDYKVQPYDTDLKILEAFEKYHNVQEPLLADDVLGDHRLASIRQEALTRQNVLSLFVVPISYEERLLGVLAGLRCESEARWTEYNEAFLKSVADQVAIGVINARLYAKVERQATTDGLTGLFNHRTGQEKLAEQLRLAERYRRNLSVIMFDVDHFKSINDKYGHPAGDSVLKSVAKLIQRDCRDVDVPVRYGGEEFLLILPEVNSEGAAVVAERIRKNLEQEVIHHDDVEVSVTASMGIASFPEHAKSQQQLLDLADKSLYLSKRLGRNQVHLANDLANKENPPTQSPATAITTKEVAEKIKNEPTFVAPRIPKALEEKEELVPEVVEMVKALATTLYSKSNYNKVHHLETARLSELLARVMGMSKQEVEQIRVAGLLHDVGTLSMPADLLAKEGKFTPEERRIINQHPVLGAELLRPVRALKDICEILENHHERWDGTGYPRGLKGEDIPLAARIVAIVDSYHAMISDRPYRPAMTQDHAMEVLKAGAGSQWDPFLVDIFLAVLNNLTQASS